MRRIYFMAVAALAASAILISSVSAMRIAIRNKDATTQAIEANVIVVGKVTELEKEPVNAALNEFEGSPKIDFQVATLKISENLHGAKGLTTVRIGWQPAPVAAPQPQGGGPAQAQPALRPAIIRPGRGGFQPVALTVGQEGCFFLKKHPEADFYVLVPNGKPIDKKAENFEQEVTQVKKVVKAIENPVESLKAKEATDRQLAANVIVRKYRTYIAASNGEPKQEEIPAEESKLILKTVAEMEWANTGGAPFDPSKIYASNIFYQLGIQQGQDGYNPPKFEQGQQDYNKVLGDYTTKWLKDNADKYRIKKFVAEKK